MAYVKSDIMEYKLLLVLSFLLLLSCESENRIYSEHKELSPDVEWLKSDIQEFEIPISDVESSYQLSIAFRYASGYQYQTARIIITEISPTGIEESKEYELQIRNEKGEYLGDPAFDIWDSEHIIETNKKFSEKGSYTYRIEHSMPVDPLYYAMEIGMLLDKN